VLRDVPGQQFVDAVGLMIGDVRKHEFQVGAWIDVVQFARADQAIHCGGSLTTAVGAREHKIAPTKGHTAQGIFGEHVADLDAAVATEQRESIL
jgi:hypothetical protein